MDGAGLSVTLAPGLGGRIAGLSFDGIELLWTDPVARGGPRAPFAIPGGDKVWIAPQSKWPNARPFVALDLGAWTWDAAPALMRSPFEPLVGISLTRRVSAALGGLIVETRVEGTPSRPVGLWEVTQLRLPGLARFGCDEVEPAGEERDFAAAPRRVAEGISEVRTSGDGPWKLSSSGPCAWVEAEVAGVRLRRETIDGPPGIAEVYDSEGLGYWELELHSPIGGRGHTELWTAEAITSAASPDEL